MRKSFETQPALFAPAELLEHPAMKVLDGLEALVDWGAVEALLPRGEGKAATGRPGYAALMLFRALMLGHLYRLSDVALSHQLMRDLLFRRFAHVELDQSVPDAVTLGRFRVALDGRMAAVLEQINADLAARGLVLSAGQIAIVDASVVEAARTGRKSHDPEAGIAVKKNSKGKLTAQRGWRGYVNVDETNTIRRVDLAPGNEAEVKHLAGLMAGGERAVCADAAYIGPTTRALIAEGGLEDGVMRRGAPHHPLSEEGRARNRDLSTTRRAVERVFGHFKRVWNMGRARFMGLRQNRIWWSLAAVAWNLTNANRRAQSVC